MGHLEVVRALIAAGADVNLPNKDGLTALILAAKKGHLEVVQVLIAAGAKKQASSSLEVFFRNSIKRMAYL